MNEIIKNCENCYLLGNCYWREHHQICVNLRDWMPDYPTLEFQLSTANERINSQSGTIQRLKERENRTDKVLTKDSQLLQAANEQITRMREIIGRIVITPNISADEMEKLYDEAMEFLKQPALVDTSEEENNE